MEQILNSLEIDWYINSNGITAEVIYLSTYIKFNLYKIQSNDGDIYRLTIDNDDDDTDNFEIKYFLNKLACAGLRFMFETNDIYPINPQVSRRREYNELHLTFEVDEEFEHDPIALDNAMFDSFEETLNDYRDSNREYDISDDVLELTNYLKFYTHINPTQFSQGNRWVNIGFNLLNIAKFSRDCENTSLEIIIMFCIHTIVQRFGATADISFLKEAKEFAALFCYNPCLKRWNNYILCAIAEHNRIFYVI